MKTQLLKTLKEVYNGRSPEGALEEVFSLFGVCFLLTDLITYYN